METRGGGEVDTRGVRARVTRRAAAGGVCPGRMRSRCPMEAGAGARCPHSPRRNGQGARFPLSIRPFLAPVRRIAHAGVAKFRPIPHPLAIPSPPDPYGDPAMKKIRLDVDALRVQSYPTTDPKWPEAERWTATSRAPSGCAAGSSRAPARAARPTASPCASRAGPAASSSAAEAKRPVRHNTKPLPADIPPAGASWFWGDRSSASRGRHAPPDASAALPVVSTLVTPPTISASRAGSV